MSNAKKKTGTPSENPPRTPQNNRRRNDNLVWFNPSINAEDEKWLGDNLPTIGQVVCQLVDGMSTDDRLSCKFDTNSGRWLATVFVDTGNESKTVIGVSLRGATAADALYGLAYCVVYKHEWQFDVESPDDQRRWG